MSRSLVPRLPVAPGVYRFRDVRGRVLYIGRATELRYRVGSYWTDLGKRRHLARMVPQITRIEALTCDSVHEAAWLERNLLERSKPRWNRTRGGQEVPFCIRLADFTLQAVHWPPVASGGLIFGPYLGGTQARLAVSALERVLPLRYTADRLGGSQRDMAAILGVGAGDRDHFVTLITAVLRREPAAVSAVRARLAELRDRASERLGFELAARIQQEIEAVDWVVAEQKVTTLTPGDDAEAYGWSGGVLVRFQIRAGRLSGWEQRGCSQRAAEPHVARTPPQWRDFANRNAELATRLVAESVPSGS
ncbi:GIY-YIG nuclease family protein [Actinoplanes sp. NPDC048988]|uniref:GIY-YIG nuclease family protein n=1 Tax=Actinoplanes sp. NPDC048988 TaxID=3363901 RepID=UPI00371CC778